MSNDNTIPFRRPDALARFAKSPLVAARYGGADEARLAAFETRHEISLSEGYRDFLMRENGLDYHIPHTTIATLPAEAQSDAFVLSDINTLFGIGNGHPYFDLEELAPDMDFHDYGFTPFAHVVGLGGDFSTLVEITEGKHAGAIMYTDGELFHGMRSDGIGGKSADEAIDDFIENGYYYPIATNLSDLFEKYARLS